MMHINEKTECVGCGACVEVCPKKAIAFQADAQGFNYPYTNKNLCVDCGRCERTCPVIKQTLAEYKQPACMVAWNKDDAVRKASTS